MLRLLKRAAAILGGLILTILLVLTVILGWMRMEDPILTAHQVLPPFAQTSRIDAPENRDGERRIQSDIVLSAPGELPVRFAVSLPEDADGAPMPVQIVVGGLRAGKENIQRLPSPVGHNAIIAFEYPERDAINDKKASTLSRILAIRKGAVATPGQLVAILRWAREQPWADPGRVSLLGYSLGAIFVPAALETAKANGIDSGVTILAFGGADVGAIVPQALKMKSPNLRWIVGILADCVLHPVEPSYFLPLMETETLLINAEADELIPPASARLMTELAPPPKWVMTMPGDHINPRDQAVLTHVVNISRDWLIARGAANDPR